VITEPIQDFADRLVIEAEGDLLAYSSCSSSFVKALAHLVAHKNADANTRSTLA
jgi:hypothetical protein